jgi:glucose/arabinose dehydrogenase
VASPTTPTIGGGAGGQAAILVLPDDNGDGFADSTLVFKNNLPSTQGMLFAGGYFYFQNGTQIMREPYTSGQRQDNGQITQVADITIYVSCLHWPKPLDVSDDGTIYVGNGGDQGLSCQLPMPFQGGILKLDPAAGTAVPVVSGLRNPIAVRCHHDGNNLCYATELSRDYSASMGGREKVISILAGDNYGYPCCATQGLAFSDQCLTCSTPGTLALGESSPICANATTAMCSPDCSSITADSISFVIGDTPLGVDFVDTQFPAPWQHKMMIALHGAAGSWAGARVVAVGFDPATGLALSATDLDDGGVDTGAMSDFATGWVDHAHGRPANLEVSPDGRLFLGNDISGEIIWFAPVTLP